MPQQNESKFLSIKSLAYITPEVEMQGEIIQPEMKPFYLKVLKGDLS